MVFDPKFVSLLESRYEDLLGHYPKKLEQRLELASKAGREDAVIAIEALRQQLISNNPLDRKIQQLVHFSMLIARNEHGAAKLHAAAAILAGATVQELHGVAETAAIVCGMPGYSLAVDLISQVLLDQ